LNVVEDEDWLSSSLNESEENQFIIRCSGNSIFEENIETNTPSIRIGTSVCEKGSGLILEKKILGVEYDSSTNDLTFHFEQSEISGQNLQTRVSRLELLKNDPLLVLNFYENNYHLTKNMDLKQK